MGSKTEPTRGKLVIGAAIIGLAAGCVGAGMWGFGMMAIGQFPGPMNLIGAFGVVTVGLITAAVVIAEYVLFR